MPDLKGSTRQMEEIPAGNDVPAEDNPGKDRKLDLHPGCGV
jgi:hypothetical protein